VVTSFDIESDNFELFFEKQLEGISEAGRAVIPRDVATKIFWMDGRLNPAGAKKLGFLAKIWILWRALRKRVFIIVENEETGIGLEEFVELREAIKRRDFGIKKAEGLAAQATFVTGNKELCDTMNYLNGLSASPTYNYLTKAKNFTSTKTAEHRRHMDYIVRFLRFYEGNKKKWIQEKQLHVPEYLVLLYLYDKDATRGSEMYLQTYRTAFQSSPSKIKNAFITLQRKGLIIKHNTGSAAKMQITPMGIDLMNYVLMKYAINC
jgi:hypothetical protein